jgi:hypothetical protein
MNEVLQKLGFLAYSSHRQSIPPIVENFSTWRLLLALPADRSHIAQSLSKVYCHF